jgi:hypothetical protein
MHILKAELECNLHCEAALRYCISRYGQSPLLRDVRALQHGTRFSFINEHVHKPSFVSLLQERSILIDAINYKRYKYGSNENGSQVLKFSGSGSDEGRKSLLLPKLDTTPHIYCPM